MKTGLLTLLTLLLTVHAQAGSATWNTNPPQSFWSVSRDWTPNTVPNGPSDVATFGTSSQTNIANAGLNLSQMIFNPGASSYNITPTPFVTFIISGPGITNNSGALQVFTIGPGNTQKHTEISFVNGASAGVSTQFINRPSGNIQVLGGLVSFYDSASAGTAIFVNNPKTTINGGSGLVYFDGSSTAGSATFLNSAGIEFFGSSSGGSAQVTNEGSNGAVSSAAGDTVFNGNADAGNGTYVENDGVAGANGGFLEFGGTSSAGSATLIANGGLGGGPSILFDNGSPRGGLARVELFGNAILDITFTNPPGTTIGSLEGSGTAYVGANTLTVGSNNLSTTFSGLLTDLRQFGGSGGGIAKIGTGTFTVSGANTYPGGTVVSAGTLVVSNTTGSGTGTGAVQVNGGSLGGSGTIAGPVAVNSGAFVAPAHGTKTQSTLTIQSALTFNAGSTYTYTFKAKGKQAKTDKVIVSGVTINSGASFNLSGTTKGTLTSGLVLMVISNTSANAINGTFANLPDGAIVNVNGNNLQASYESGDGNDLTLTVVP